jgi:hypothetical protein
MKSPDHGFQGDLGDVLRPLGIEDAGNSAHVKSRQFFGQERADILDGIQIFGDQFVIFDFDLIRAFEMRNKLENPRGIDDARVEKRFLIGQSLVDSKKEIIHEILANFRFKSAHVERPFGRTGGTCSLVVFSFQARYS